MIVSYWSFPLVPKDATSAKMKSQQDAKSDLGKLLKSQLDVLRGLARLTNVYPHDIIEKVLDDIASKFDADNWNAVENFNVNIYLS